jgi:hypothetical protein
MKRGPFRLLAAVPWRPVASFTTAGLLLMVVAAIWVTGPTSGNAVKGCLAAFAAAVAYLLDEAATEAAAAAPTTLRARSLARLCCGGVIAMLGLAGIAAVLLRSGGFGRAGIAAQLIGCLLATLAAAAAVRRRFAEPGEVVAAVAVGLIVMFGFLNPFGRWFDLFPSVTGQHWDGSLAIWAAVGLLSVVVLGGATRDPLD